MLGYRLTRYFEFKGSTYAVYKPNTYLRLLGIWVTKIRRVE